MNQNTPPCIRCGRPSDDHHHARHDNLNMGKGSGGTSHDDSHFLMLDMCRECHDRAHMKLTLFTYDEAEGIVRWTDIGGGTGERSLRIQLDETDAYLAQAWAKAQQAGEESICIQAEVAYAFRKKYGGFDRWWARVADIIMQETGVSVSVGTVYDRAALGTALAAWAGQREHFLGALGVKVASAAGQAIAAGSDPGKVFEFAFEQVDENKKTVAARLIKQEFLPQKISTTEESQTCYEHTCSSCGARWNV